MSDSLVRLMVLLLRPVEVWWSWRWQRAYRAGKFSRPAEWSPVQGSPCVTTKRAA